MQNGILRKGLVVGIILLFVGTCIIPTIAESAPIKNEKRNERNHYLPISPRCYYFGIIDNLSVNGTTYLFEAINLRYLGFDGYGNIYYSHIKHEPMHYYWIFENDAQFHGILRPHFICGVFIYY